MPNETDPVTQGEQKAFLKQHRIFLGIFVILVLIRLPLLWHIPEYLLLNQDYNPTHLGQIFWGEEWPRLDDHEVGENARYLAWTNIYYLIPTLAYKLGVPFNFWYGLHLLLGMPLLLLCQYFLAYVLFRNPGQACFAALNFHFAKWIFELNFGYTLVFDYSIYQGDIPHIPAAAFLVFLIRGNLALAGLCSLVLSLLNPTYGVNAWIILMSWMVWRWWRRGYAPEGMIPAGLLAGAGVLGAYVLVTLATPIKAPVPQEVRDFCILTYFHFTPHIFAFKYWVLTASLFGLLLGAWCIDRWRRPPGEVDNPREPARVMGFFLFIFLFYYLGVYFLLYVASPSVFILFSPSKSGLFLVFLANAYFSLALYNLLGSYLPYSLLPISVYAYLVYRDQTGMLVAAVLGLIWVLGIVALIAKKSPGFEFRPMVWSQAGAVALLLLYSCGVTLAQLYSPRMTHAAQLYDVELKIKESIPKDAIFVPYNPPGSTNTFGPFRGHPLRTFSRRGVLIYWSLLRNAYFNSQERMAHEVRAYREAGGIDVWGNMLAKARKSREEEPLRYYLGIRTNPFQIEKTSYNWEIVLQEKKKLKDYIYPVNLEDYLDYGRRLGATHVLICKDPARKVENYPVLVGNDYFSVIEIPK